VWYIESAPVNILADMGNTGLHLCRLGLGVAQLIAVGSTDSRASFGHCTTAAQSKRVSPSL